MNDEPATAACSWCSSPLAPGDARCRGCGAATAQRESIGGVDVPGVTTVDPWLTGDHLAMPSLTPVRLGDAAPGAMPVPANAAALFVAAGIAVPEIRDAVLDTLSLLGTAHTDPSKIGQPSEAVRLLAEQLDRQEHAPAEPAVADGGARPPRDGETPSRNGEPAP